MIPIPSGGRVWIATGHTDMRRGMQGLALQVQESLRRELDAAIAHFNHGIRLSPLDPRVFLAYSGLANAHFLAGRYDKALECATTGLRKWPNFIHLQRNAAACYAMSGQVGEAKQAWQVASQLDPTQSISGLRSQTLFRSEDFEKFAECYRIAGMPE